MKCIAPDNLDTQATVGTARALWSASKAGTFAHHVAAAKPMSGNYVVFNATSIRHRPPEDSS